MNNRRLFGLLGKNISHSFSPGYFKEKFRKEGISAEYVLFDLPNIEKIKDVVNNNPQLEGFNVTIPYKKEIIPLLDTVDDMASTVGAVNVVKIYRHSRKPVLKGFNTDVTGFRKSLNPLIAEKKSLKALVLGTGGASDAVCYAIKLMNIPFIKISRKKNKDTLTYEELSGDLIRQHRLIVNTTPLGMNPETDTFPNIPYEYITKQHILYDLIYNPVKTKFLMLGENKGALIKNGLEMLHGQADAAWEIWNR